MEVAEFKVLRDIRNELQITNKNLDEIKNYFTSNRKRNEQMKKSLKSYFFDNTIIYLIIVFFVCIYAWLEYHIKTKIIYRKLYKNIMGEK